MGLVDDYLSAYKVGKKEQMAARMAFFITANWRRYIGHAVIKYRHQRFYFYAAGRYVKPQLWLQKGSAYCYRHYGSGFDNFIAAWKYLGIFGISCGFWCGNGLHRR